ncbi:hypothetical protein H2201_003098 [Coniosporium apollinis]|uniref:DUF1275 domain-containing protein n=2 Tax=Coniosporium TaxID=2810619 RepID=A0ABQ9NZK2_9PEZI|nr:hypothetical protein H2199_008439 [Cladosporium sp. JES 115]KAJ9666694.1 hypothetical protein H2201_003098 [Coniosporium apollinis]
MTFVWYRAFVSKQTGNTVLVALAALESQAVVQTEPHVVISLCVFIAGVAIFGHIGHLIGQHRRVWLIISNVLQTALVFGATALRFWGSDSSNGPESVGVVALLALAMSGQIALALCVKMPELNTTMITGALVMLAVDRNIFKRKNLARNRRVLSLFTIVAGGFIGAAIDRYYSPTFSLLLVATIKTIVTIMFLFNRGTKQRRINLEGTTENARSSVTFLKVIWGD